MTPTENFNYKIKNCKKQKDFECQECNKGYSGPICKPLPIDNCIGQKGLTCFKCRRFYRLVNNKCLEPPMKKDCVDLKKDCQQFVRDGKCDVYKNIAEKVCKRSCNLCPIDLKQLMYYKNFTTDKSQLSVNLKDKYRNIYHDSVEIKDKLMFDLDNDDRKKIKDKELLLRLKKIEDDKLEDLKLRKLNESLHQKQFFLKWDDYINEQDENRYEQDILSDKYLKQDPIKILYQNKDELDEQKIRRINKIKNKIKNKFRKEREEDEMRRLIEEEELDEINRIKIKHQEEEDYKRYLYNLRLQEEEDENLIRGNRISNDILRKEQKMLEEDELKQKIIRDEREELDEELNKNDKIKTMNKKIAKSNSIKDKIRKKEKIRQERQDEEALEEQNSILQESYKKMLEEEELVDEERKKKMKIIEEEIAKSMYEEEEKAMKLYQEEEEKARELYQEEEELILEEKRKEDLERKIREAELRKQRIMIGLTIALFIIIVLAIYQFVLKKKIK